MGVKCNTEKDKKRTNQRTAGTYINIYMLTYSAYTYTYIHAYIQSNTHMVCTEFHSQPQPSCRFACGLDFLKQLKDKILYQCTPYLCNGT